MTISVLLVEDHRLVREALRDALAKEPDIKVVGEAENARAAFDWARRLAPEVVVLDDSLPDMNSIEAAVKVKERAGGNAKIVALSVHTDRHFVTEMLRAGVSAYVTKSSAATVLLEAIRAVAAGQSYICSEVVESLLSSVRDGPESGETPQLSRRECEVLRLMADGIRSLAIAEQLHISLGTVEVHRRNIRRKLELHTVAELTRYAIREGLVAPWQDPKSKDWRDWPYLAGDGAVQAADGYYRILGRIDDVINVAGHRLGTKEIESAALLVPEVVEAAVVPVADEIKGKVPDLYVSLKSGLAPSVEIANKVSAAVVSEIGAIARPRRVIIVPDMPKTRSGKIMRRVLASISNRKDPGDVSTLANPEVVDKIKELAK